MNALRLIPNPERWADVIRYALLLIVVLDSALLYESYRATQSVTRDMEHNVIEEQLFSDLKDAECGQRGYLYTADDRYLPQYYVGVENTRADMTILKQYLSDDVEVKPIVDELDTNVDVKLEELDSTVRAYRAGHTDKAKAIVTTGAGRVEMERVRTNIGTLRAYEQKELHRHRRWPFF